MPRKHHAAALGDHRRDEPVTPVSTAAREDTLLSRAEADAGAIAAATRFAALRFIGRHR